MTPVGSPGRIAVVPLVGGFATRNCGWSVADYYRDPARSFLAQIRCAEQYGYDGDPGYGYAAYGAWELGGEIRWPTGEYDQAPEVVRHPVSTPDDVDRLRVPADVATVGAVPLMLAFSRLQQQAGLPVSVHLGGAFTRAIAIVPPGVFFRWIRRSPDLVHQVLRVATDFLLAVARLWVSIFPGATLVGSTDAPAESNYLLSPDQFREFSLPYLVEVHEKALGMGFQSFYAHLCGDHNANLPAWTEVPLARPGAVGTMSFGHEVPLERAIEVFGERAVIMGNIDPGRLQLGEVEEIRESVRHAVTVGKRAPRGYILAPGCELPVHTPPYHLHTFVQACREFSGRKCNRS
jgi:Uroporphyrinogen-III decarboxylase